jgi:hypothetical protein
MKPLAGATFDGLAVVTLQLQSSPAGGPVAIGGAKVVLTAGQLILGIESTIQDMWPPEVQQKARELIDAVETHLATRPPFALAPDKRQPRRGITE